MSILKHRFNPVFAACPQGFVVTGTSDLEKNKFNRELLAKNATAYWIMKKGRVKKGDAIFVILPSVHGAGGYPREIHGGVVCKVLPSKLHGGRYKFWVDEFFPLDSVKSNITQYLLGKRPPHGNVLLQVWSNGHLSWMNDFERVVQESVVDNIANIQQRLIHARKIPARRLMLRWEYVRNPDVVAAVLLRAKGCCESCKLPAPFIRRSTGTPYLEVHHEVFLSDGGEDTVDNAIALCPNCHRKVHFGCINNSLSS